MKSAKISLKLLKILLNVNVISSMIAFLSVVVLCIILNLARNVFVPLVTAWFILQVLKPINTLGSANFRD